MAKDGTMRGGPRPGQGRPRKALADKINDGTADGALVLPEPASFTGEDVPPVKEYLKAQQKNGKALCAEEIYKEVYLWLKARSCEKLVSGQLIEQYAMSVSRWVQCEEAISEYDRERFEKELDGEAHYSFWAKAEWETLFTTWPPYIDAEEIERIINEYHINRKPGEPLPERVDVNLDSKYRIDVYAQLRANWDRFVDYVWRVSQNGE